MLRNFIAIIFIILPITISASLQEIVALVNNKPITLRDFNHRAKILAFSSRIDLSKLPGGELKHFRHLVLNQLIEEQLILQEAQKVRMHVTEQDVQKAFETIARSNKLSAKSLASELEKYGISVQSFKDYIRAELIKNELIRAYIASNIEVTKQEIDSELAIQNPEYILVDMKLFSIKGITPGNRKLLSNFAKRLKNCEDNKKDSDKILVTRKETFVSYLDDKIKNIVLQMADKDAKSDIFELDGSYHFIMLCKKEVKAPKEDLYQNAANLIFNQKLSSGAAKLFNILRKKAYIKIINPEMIG